MQNGQLNNNNTSPTFNNLNYVQNNIASTNNNHGINISGANGNGFGNSLTTSSDSNSSSLGSSLSSNTSSNYSFHTPRLRYYLSKSFDIEDDLEFCPDIPDHLTHGPNHSPSMKKFNAFTASTFSPTSNSSFSNDAPINLTPVQTSSNANPSSPRIHTPRIKKPLEIINPQTKLRVSSPIIHK